MKKLVSILLLIAALLACLSSCDDDPKEKESQTNTPPQKTDVSTSAATTAEDAPATAVPTTSTPAASTQTENPASTEVVPGETPVIPPEDTGIYGKYPNFEKLDEFYNGVAAFRICIDANNLWGYTTVFGYVDIEGNIIAEPKYCLGQPASHDTFPQAFDNCNYVKVVEQIDSNTYVASILDKTGTIKFKEGENGVTAVGASSNGYFWVETSKEEFTGYVYTVTYYSAKDMHTVAVFENRKHGYYSSANVSQAGTVSLLRGENYNDSYEINISDYDPTFRATEDTWTVDIDNLEAFQGVNVYKHVSKNNNTSGQIAAVRLVNKDKIYYYATVDKNGTIMMTPQKKIAFGTANDNIDINHFEFCKDLCPAYDTESGYWGYIDAYGNWKIQPKYAVAAPFTTDGYAIVNDKIVIDTTGKVVLAPGGWDEPKIETMVGSYKRISGIFEDTIILSEDGTLTFRTNVVGSGGYSSTKGKYSFKGATLSVSDLYINSALFGRATIGDFSVYNEEDIYVIGTTKWTKLGESQ